MTKKNSVALGASVLVAAIAVAGISFNASTTPLQGSMLMKNDEQALKNEANAAIPAGYPKNMTCSVSCIGGQQTLETECMAAQLVNSDEEERIYSADCKDQGGRNKLGCSTLHCIPGSTGGPTE